MYRTLLPINLFALLSIPAVLVCVEVENVEVYFHPSCYYQEQKDAAEDLMQGHHVYQFVTLVGESGYKNYVMLMELHKLLHFPSLVSPYQNRNVCFLSS